MEGNSTNQIGALETRVHKLEVTATVLGTVAIVLGLGGGALGLMLRNATDKATDALAMGSGAKAQVEAAVDTAKVQISKHASAVSNGAIEHALSRSRLSWNPAHLEPGWSVYGRPYADPSYAKDRHGIVHLRGVVRGSAGQDVVFFLPSGYRPLVQHEVPTACGTGNSTSCEVVIQPDGKVWFERAGLAWTSFDDISFEAR